MNMITAVDSSPIKGILAAILEQFREDEPPEDREDGFRVLSYRDDFAELWGIDEPGGDVGGTLLDGDGPLNVVLIWDGVPEPTSMSPDQVRINVANHITVFDWIVAFCCRLERQEHRPRLRFFVLDLEPAACASAFGCRTLPSFLSRLPWLRVYRPAAPLEDALIGIHPERSQATDSPGRVRELLAHCHGPEVLGARCLLSDLGIGHGSPPPWLGDPDAPDSQFVATTRTLRQLWTSELTRAESRHSVSNLVASIVLAAGLGGHEEPSIRHDDTSGRLALASLLRCLGLLAGRRRPGKRSKRPGPLVDSADAFPPEGQDYFARFKKVRFLLVDDQWRLGYDDIIRRLLVGDSDQNDRISLEATHSPQCLLKAIHKTVDWSRDIPDEHATEAEFLHELLYFYHRSGACQLRDNKDDKPLHDAAKAASKFLDRRPNSTCSRCNGEVPFHGVGADTWENEDGIDWEMPRELVINASTKSDDDDQPIDILFLDLRLFGASETTTEADRTPVERHLLLPLLLSHVDPSFPIVLFSSTHQRSLLKPLAARPNIITDFAKPIVSGYSETTDASEAVRRLETAVSEALRLHRVRIVWSKLKALAEAVSFEVTEVELWSKGASTAVTTRNEDYTVDSELVVQLAREYTRLLCNSYYADALAVPGNVLESLNVDMRTLGWGATGSYQTIRQLIGLLYLRERRNEGESWFETVDRLLSTLNNNKDLELACDGLKMMLNIYGYTHQEPGGSRQLMDIQKGLTARNIRRQQEAVISPPSTGPFLESGRSKHDFALICAAASDDNLTADVARREFDTLNDLLKLFARHMLYNTAAALRNLRAHYRCRPWQDDPQLEDLAIWCWLWFIDGLLELSERRPLLQLQPELSIDALAEAHRRETIQPRKFRRTRGREGCEEVVRRVGDLLQLHVCSQPENRASIGGWERLANNLSSSFAQKQAPDARQPVVSGHIKSLITDRGFGHILSDSGDEIFFLHSVLVEADFNQLVEGQQVEVCFVTQEDGRYRATDVWAVDPTAQTASAPPLPPKPDREQLSGGLGATTQGKFGSPDEFS